MYEVNANSSSDSVNSVPNGANNYLEVVQLSGCSLSSAPIPISQSGGDVATTDVETVSEIVIAHATSPIASHGSIDFCSC